MSAPIIVGAVTGAMPPLRIEALEKRLAQAEWRGGVNRAG
jgi:hypothetical protein